MRCVIFLLSAIALPAQDAWLQRPIVRLQFEQTALPSALRSLGRACNVPVIVEPDIKGDVTADLNGTTLGAALATIVEPAGYHFEETESGIAIRRQKTVLYPIEYPQLTRSGSGSASITLGGASNHSSTNSGSFGNGNAGGLNQSGTAQTGSDATQVSILQENQNAFWTTLEAELRTMLREDESLVLNRFSGVVQITAPARRHDVIRPFLAYVGHRITQQVEIEAKLVEVTLHDDAKLGIDWDVVAHKAEAHAAVDVPGIGGTLLNANSFVAKLGFRHANAVVRALTEQGEVRTVSEPRLRALHNQTALIKVGEDRPFFRLQQSVSLNQPGSNVPFNQTQENYSVSTITIGTILAVTPHVGMDRVITLDVLPAITRLQSIVTSPDGRQTAPVTEVKQASTIVRLKDGETAVIGGLISEDRGREVRAVPVLSRVPLLGAAFRSKATLTSRTELVIFLTPRLVRF
jgi:MSHA type pilus biogenesis protein MshL